MPKTDDAAAAGRMEATAEQIESARLAVQKIRCLWKCEPGVDHPRHDSQARCHCRLVAETALNAAFRAPAPADAPAPQADPAPSLDDVRREARRQVFEEAAKIALDYVLTYERMGRFEGDDDYSDEEKEVGREIAAKLRAAAAADPGASDA